jgi:hypothetical protein
MIKGLTIILSPSRIYLGKYIDALWAEDLTENKINGLKFDIAFVPIVRVIPHWKSLFNKKLIRTVPKKDWCKFFGNAHGQALLSIDARYKDDEHPHHYGIYNPWYGFNAGVLRLPAWIPSPFLSLVTPIKDFYVGNKTYGVDVYENDVTWVSDKDKRNAIKYGDGRSYEAGCPSITLRSKKKKG